MEGVEVPLLPLVMLVLVPASSLPLPLAEGPQYIPIAWKPCVNPEECCRFRWNTVEFEECCDDHGCCPLNCPKGKGSVGDYTLSERCDEAWECCRFGPQTPEFDQCCSDHGCCPLCDQVSKGCCYNGMKYDWGTVVEEFPGMCLELLCAALVLPNTSPFFTAVIVPVKLQDYHCKGDDWCEDCLSYCCVDDTGLVHAEGAKWFPDECHECVCTNSSVTCHKLDIHCPPQPYYYCVEIPGPCCSEWDCDVGCLDEAGDHHEEGSVWYTNPCVYHTCTKDGIKTDIVDCVLGYPTHPSCQQYFPEGECCPLWNCSGCFEVDGNFHELGKEWSTGDPCISYKCIEIGIKIIHIHCEEILPFHPGCYEYTPKGECCAKLNCSGCVDHTGTHRRLDEEWKTDPCTTHVCTETGIQTTREECHLGPAPHPSCYKYSPLRGCCPVWHCSGCFDDSERFREIDEEWNTGDPCISYLCTYEGVKILRVHCQDSIQSQQPGCFEYTPEGQCCPEFNCSGCVDSTGTYHPLHDVWKTDPCTTHVCTKDGIHTAHEECFLGPAPHSSCLKHTPTGECCSEWQCTGCVDKTGNYHEVGHEWNTGDVCIKYFCTQRGLEVKHIRCRKTPPPHPSCYEYTPDGECCPEWDCSGCVDHTDIYHPLHDVWKTDSCTTHNCTKTGIRTTREECHLGPAPHSTCLQYTTPGECCPEWECGGCYDEAGRYRTPGQEWNTGDPCLLYTCGKAGAIKITYIHCEEIATPHPGCYEYIPEGECCPKLNCSGCVDHAGTYHPLHDVWKTDLCTTHVCTNSGIQTEREHCHLEPAPHHSCIEFVPPGKCCSEWQCRGCFDGQGHFHEIGHEWNTGDLCVTYVCTEDGLQTIRERCEDVPPPHPGCYQYRVKGECCPVWNCSGCVDNDHFHPLHDVWKTDLCTTHVCTNSGIHTTIEKCHLGPEPHPSCVEYSPPGECCPEWQCSGCLDKAGNYFDVGREWSTGNPCMTYVCAEGGVTKTKRIHCEDITPPHESCHEYIPEGECCPKWNCSGCVDHTDIYHPLHDVWKTDSCTTHNCTKTGIRTTREECHLGPAPHSTCLQYTTPGECCPEWECGGCYDEAGRYRTPGQEWNTGDPCLLYTCGRAGAIKITYIHCEEIATPHPGCYEYIPEGECCPKLNCSGCVDHAGTYHPLHDIWKTDLCTTHVCTNSGIQTEREDCHLEPAPHHSCIEFVPPGKCCSEWQCRGCFDGQGHFHEIGHEWNTGDPCVTYVCTEDGLQTIRERCEDIPPPHPGCYQYRVKGECCPVWNCSGCVDNDHFHPLHDVWKTDLCTTHVCTQFGIHTTREKCHLGPEPHPSCLEYTPPGECCPEWQCSGCFDKAGNYFDVGHEWSTGNPCMTYVCAEGGVTKTKRIHCEDVPPPHESCHEYIPEGECCPEWSCSGCVDHTDIYHPLHDVWKTDSCTSHNCTKTGIRTTREECHLGPAPHSTCLQYTTPGECCPEWECGGCYDEAGRYRTPGQEWNTGDPCLLYKCGKAGAIKITYIHCEEIVTPHPGCYEYIPEGECCPKLNCSGCVDHAGTYHPLHDVWKTDLCTTHVCTNSGIQTEREDCHLEPAPHHSCIEFVPPGKCCSEWQCRGCFDGQGNFHEIGHEWNTGDPCITYVCREDGLQTIRERCEDIPPPHPGCYQYRVEGECCPVWNCSGCVDNDHFHPLHDVWKTDLCTTHVCTNSGIHTTREKCHLGPEPHPSCVEYTPPGECCPEWQCSGCFDKAGNYFDVGREWSTGDPCMTYVCAEGGVTKTKRIHCEDVPPPHESCHEYIPEGKCCPEWSCSGCVDHTDIYHPLHDVWKTDSCTTHNCTKTGIRTTREECHLGPAPHSTCLQYTTPGECCPEWECGGCYDEAGRYRTPGQEWNTGDPCLLYTCGKAGAIKITYIHCEEIVTPHPGCYEYIPEGECCPKLNCSGCVDHAGTYHPLHDVWKTDLCTTHVCTNSGIQTEREDCHLEPAPHHSCIEFVPPGKCCSEWQCRGCFDGQGNFHEIGHEWNTGDPCVTYVCTEDGLQTIRERCEDVPPPHPGCYQYRVEGECCPVWNCSGCVDHDHFHPLHDVWKTDLCTTHVCTNSGIHTTREKCHLGPEPHPSCVEYSPPGECCPEWQCSGCFDKAGNYFDVGHEWSTGDPCMTYVCAEGGVTKTKRIHCEDIPPPHESCHEYIPEGKCCPEWSCSGCIDHTDTYHRLSDTWKTDDCTTHVCLETGIRTTREECHRLGPAPHPNCLEYTPPGECCPDWQCSGCFDEAGIYHELDEEWASGDLCMYYHCTKEGIKVINIQCEDIPPLHSGCYQYTPLGECCPVWNCSGCVDHTNAYRPLFHVWKTDLCTTHVCLETGIETTREECHLGPAPHPSCQQYTPPRECCPEWHCSGCFDEDGTYHESGHKWNTGDPCISYVCTEGEIKIERVHCEETQPPHPGCYDYVPVGECCPKWNCSGCVDHAGTYHKLQDVWKTDLCTTHVCTRSGIQTTREECHLGPAPDPGCIEYTRAGECCADWLCSGCVDKAGVYYELDQEWSSDDPCMMYKCTEGGVIKVIRIECEELPPPHAACYEYIPVGECCPQWNCSGCVDHTDTYHPMYDVWKTDVCTTHVCTETGIQTTRIECYLGPAPHPSCLEYTPPGECCPEWECSGCFDDSGKYYELGQKWTTGDPCVLYECVKEGIKVTLIHCEDTPPPHSGCYEYTAEGECCPVWNCSGCVDHDGTYHPLHDVWRSDLCNTHECTRAGILTTREKCHLGPAPHPSCNEYTPPGECCPEWHCSGCFDAAGIYRELGHEWSTSDPCITYVCTEDGVDINRVHCEETFPLHPDCFDYIPDGECCPKWNCSGCVDYSGKYYTLYSVWKTDLCTTHECTRNGIQTTLEDCNLGPAPHYSCERFTLPGECCPEWKCSGCFDEVGTYHVLGHVWNKGDPCIVYECTEEGLNKRNVECKETPPLHSGCYEYTPEGECCPVWNCSGCVDHTDTYHPLYDVWKTDICNTHVCSKTGIQTTREECYLGPAPHPSCIEYTPPEECCPDWECSGCFEAGSYYELGHEWSTSDPCLLLVCTKDGIKKKPVDCEETPQPQPGCYEYVPTGECCPKWNCSGCVDASGTYYPLYHVWGSEPCIKYVCTRTGIQTSTEECQPLGPPADPSCEKVVPRGQCCPEWECSGCVDDYGVYHLLHKQWVTDVCTTHTCTVNGLLTVRDRCHLDPSPHYSCREYTPEGECCPIWNCSGCIDKLSGTYHDLHSTWQTGPCITHECGQGGIKTILEKCQEKPQPHCEEISPPPGECCSQWKCSGCYEAGTHYNVGSKWRTDPCTSSLCTDEGIRVTKEICEPSLPPHYSCVEYTPAGECCPIWNCSGCIDGDGVHHELNDEWKTDPCTTHLCTTSAGIQITTEVCEFKPAPDAKCREYTPPGECCPRWKCTLDSGFLSTVVLDGCIDEDSVRHKYGHKWIDVSDPCFQYECTRHGVIQRYNICV